MEEEEEAREVRRKEEKLKEIHISEATNASLRVWLPSHFIALRLHSGIFLFRQRWCKAINWYTILRKVL